ncbi:unnamed protein product [Schistocephalus solidus]|uniref:Uncharacterized protein n=1 Tax=Schistocephalus solidus TaxID=70667 RepID=A0A183SH77_SCHSO|nr:unnamed protein product [Schistocephalus solidus]
MEVGKRPDRARVSVDDNHAAGNSAVPGKVDYNIIQGLVESPANDPKERISADLEQFQELINEMLQQLEDITILKAFRLRSNLNVTLQTRPRLLKPDYSPAERMKIRELALGVKTRRPKEEQTLIIYKDEIVKRLSVPLMIKPVRMTAHLLK